MAGVPEVIALGTLALAVLGATYLAFYPAAVLVWRQHLEMTFTLERAEGELGFYAGRPFRVVVMLRNRAPRPLGAARVRLMTSAALRPPDLRLTLLAQSEGRAAGEVLPLSVGHWFLHGAAVELTCPFGLSSVEAYFPSSVGVKVFPRPIGRARPVGERPRIAGGNEERGDLCAPRLRGQSGELRELREHRPGDPWKQIAWKATARTGKLMVREHDRETVFTHWFLVDLGGSMRAGGPGATKLDRAIDLMAAHAEAALSAGERVGLCLYDGRIVAVVKPSDGLPHRLRLAEQLIETARPIDEDLTELTDSELVALVARYLIHQEGIDTRVARAPSVDDPAWAHLSAAPSGELFDLRRLKRAVEEWLVRHPSAHGAAEGEAAVRASDADMRRLRWYCKLRGIELGHRATPEAGRRARGLQLALELAARGRGGQRILVLSDLEGLDGDLELVGRAVRLCRRRGHQLGCLLLSVDRGPAAGRELAVEDEILGWHTVRKERRTARRMGALGLRVQLAPEMARDLGPSPALPINSSR
jgi:uncharacterized protein (DUF58 family)